MIIRKLAGIIGISVIIFLNTGCRILNLKTSEPVSNKYPQIRLSVLLAPGSRGTLDTSPGRVYVTRKGEAQKPPRLLLKVSGLKKGMKIYWSYQFHSGRHNPIKSIYNTPFSACLNHHLNLWENSTIADNHGESMVFFTTTTYAGDRFQFGIGFRKYTAVLKDDDSQPIKFRNAALKSETVEVWKRIFFERPKILKNVKFPVSTWKYVRKNLEKLQIEAVGNFTPVELDPVDPAISYYFYTRKGDEKRGKGKDPRYGPGGFGPLEVMLSRMTIIFSDRNPNTLNTFIFGCISPKYDLICDGSPAEAVSGPVNYSRLYRKDEINLKEWYAPIGGSSMAGKSPAIFIWSDFWYLAGKSLGVTHEKSLARVILHELGHVLLMFKTGGEEGILDESGHPSANIITGQSIMTGSGIIYFDRRGKPFVSTNAKRMERRFIEHPAWNPKIEMLIRRDYVPSEK